MPVFENFPYTNFHELNLDWMMQKMKDLETQVQDLRDYIENSGLVEDVQTKQDGSWVTAVTDRIAKIPVSDTGVSGTVTSEEIETIAAAAAPVQDFQLFQNGEWTSIVDDQGDVQFAITGDMLPLSGVTADTYGKRATYSDWRDYPVFNLQVDDTGRVIDVSDWDYNLKIRQSITTITPGLFHGNVNFNGNNFPWYDNGMFVNINVYEYDTSGKVNVMKLLIPGVDYDLNLYDTGYADVQLTSAKANTVYVVANGCYGLAGM